MDNKTKPILIIRLNYSSEAIDKAPEIRENISAQLEREYHVLILFEPNLELVTFECMNDCSGIKDLEINEIITQLEEKYGSTKT